MSIRITETMRKTIIHRLLQHAYEKEEKDLQRREHELGMKVYRRLYSTSERKHMNGLPEGWLHETDSIRVRLGADNNVALSVTASVRIPRCALYNYKPLDTRADANQPLVAEIKAHCAARQKLKDARRETNQKTKATIKSFSTLNRLLSAWPEVKPFTDQLGYDVEKKSLPAVIPTELNASLGLPVTGKQ